MRLKFLFTGSLIVAMPLSWSNCTLAEVALKYDPFKDKTTVTVIGQPGESTMYLWGEFDGKKPKLSQTMQLGFLLYPGNNCPHPNFIADGQRVKPSPYGEILPGIDSVVEDIGQGQRPYMDVFNFYELPKIRQIAQARSVQYQVCNRVANLAPQDQAKLGELLHSFNLPNTDRTSCSLRQNLDETARSFLNRCRPTSAKARFPVQLLPKTLGEIRSSRSNNDARDAWNILTIYRNRILNKNY